MNEATRHRLALAHKIAPAYAANPKVAVVVLAGSVGRGTADRFSDIEIDVFWTAAPTEDERRTLITAGGGVIYHMHPFEQDEWAETFFIEGIKVDTSQFLVEAMERYLADAVERADIAVDPQLLIAAIQHGVPLHGAELVERWRAKAATYPDTLVRAMVAQYLDFRPRFYAEMFAARDDLLLLYRALVEIEHRILGVLMGLNRLYMAHPAFKWMDWQIAQMRVAPPDLARRLKQILRTEPQAAAREIHQLVEEVFDLVEQHLP
ncbi:MAG: hypothetical protein ACJ8CR_05225, partial [Roseiflexaceae bacterium]